MPDEPSESVQVDPTSSVDPQQLAAAASNTTEIAAQEATQAAGISGAVRVERSGVLGAAEESAAGQGSGGAAVRRRPAGAGN
ncbi:hypothetical protein GCM10018779_52960 [Streptomyces griseocarneus]|nr:hypothetical protein GCM10018779_52960 [Streptomyces griseocarneus]